jgi:SnoaL-like domain
MELSRARRKHGILDASMSQNVEIVRRIFEAWSTGDFRAGAEDFEQHVTFVIAPELPEFGVFVGPEGVREYMRRVLQQWERLTIEAKRLQVSCSSRFGERRSSEWMSCGKNGMLSKPSGWRTTSRSLGEPGKLPPEDQTRLADDERSLSPRP